VRDSEKMRACGASGAPSSNDPAGIITTSEFFACRGKRPPQVAQKLLVNRMASGTLYVRTCSSPPSHVSVAGCRNIFEACPVPVALRQREQ